MRKAEVGVRRGVDYHPHGACVTERFTFAAIDAEGALREVAVISLHPCFEPIFGVDFRPAFHLYCQARKHPSAVQLLHVGVADVQAVGMLGGNVYDIGDQYMGREFLLRVGLVGRHEEWARQAFRQIFHHCHAPFLNPLSTAVSKESSSAGKRSMLMIFSSSSIDMAYLNILPGAGALG